MTFIFRRCLFFILWTGAGPVWGAVDPELRFLENRGQGAGDFYAESGVDLVTVRAGELGFYLYDGKQIEYFHEQYRHQITEAGMKISQVKLKGQFIRLSFIGAAPSAPVKHEKFSDYYNFFKGRDSSQWISRVHAFQRIEYKNLYPGIHWMVTSQGKNLKHEFYVQPFADPALVRWSYEGQSDLYIDKNGDLIVKNIFGEHTELKPVCYQRAGSKKVYIRARYVLRNREVQIVLDESYDATKELVLDPLLIFSTYSGSTADNWGSTATPGERGRLYSSGIVRDVTASEQLPITAGVFQEKFGSGKFDVAILKYDSAGKKLLYGTYLGGSSNETPHSLVMNAQNELLLLGTTSSTDFPTTEGVVQRVFNGGKEVANKVVSVDFSSDIFVVKISENGTRLLASTYLGGKDNDGLNDKGGIPDAKGVYNRSALDKNYGDSFRGDIITHGDAIYLSTVTASSDFPVSDSGFSTTYKGGDSDAIVVSLSQDLKKLNWTNFLGGSKTDASHTIQIDERGNLYVAGGTTSPDFPFSSEAFQKSNNGDVDGWIALLAKDGRKILHATYTGTARYDQIYFLDLDPEGSVYVYGQTNSALFPVTPGVYNNPRSGQFLQKFDSTLTTLIYSTVFGSGAKPGAEVIPNISPTAFLVNDCGLIYMAGWGGQVNFTYWGGSGTRGMKATSDAYQSTTGGSDFYFCALSADATKLHYATFMGGKDSRTHIDGGTCRFDKAGVVYHAVCSGCSAFNQTNKSTSDFPTTEGAYSRLNRSSNCNNAAFKFDLSLLKANLRTNTPDKLNPGKTSFCTGSTVLFENLSFGGMEYQWVIDNNDFITKKKEESLTYKFDKEGVYPISLKAVDNASCVGVSRANTSITIHAPQGRVGGDKTICLGSSTTLDAFHGVTYEWTSEDQTEIHQTDKESVEITPGKTTTYSVNITDANNCLTSGKVKVKVLLHLKANLQTNTPDKLNPGRTSFCLGSTVLFENLSAGGTEYYWDIDNNQTVKLTKQSVTYKFDKEGVYPIGLKALDNTACESESRASTVITVNAPQGRVGGDKTICLGSSTTLDAFHGVTYEWTSEDQKEKYESNEGSVEITPAKTTTYRVNITDASNCLTSGKVKVKVVKPVDLKWNIEYGVSCEGFQPAHIQNLSDSLPATYIDLGDGNISREPDFWYTYAKPGEYTVKLKGEREICSNELEHKVPILELKIPNVFTPGTRDNLNDTFKILANNLPAAHFFKIKLEIVNRHGKPVYRSDNYQNDWTGDGLTGTYYYTVKAEGKFECKGWVQIID